MRLAIADPPYLGRAALWYGGKGRSKQGTRGRAVGRGALDVEYHPAAIEWDDPARHVQLLEELETCYDGWAMAASSRTLHRITPAMPDAARVAVWVVPNATPTGNRVRHAWEAVIIRQPDGRRVYGSGRALDDVLTAPHPVSGFVGSKPKAWTWWVLDMLGYDAQEDEVTDLFMGSGAVSAASEVLF